MGTDQSNTTLTLEAVAKLVHLLQPLSAEDRDRAISAAFILLGHPTTTKHTLPRVGGVEGQLEAGDGISGKALAWMKKNSITREQLDHIYSIEHDSIDVIGSKMPGKSKRQQTLQAYVLCGLKSFLLTSEVTFTDKDAREVCQKVGCYDIPNHSNYMKAFANLIGGTKDVGWKLTNPGLTEAAKIVKELTAESHA